MKPRAARYQEQVSGVSHKRGYVLGGFTFDGYKNGVLIEAKGPGYHKFVDESGILHPWFRGLVVQARNQSRVARAAGNIPVEWHVAELDVVTAIRTLFRDLGIRNIKLIHTPYKP